MSHTAEEVADVLDRAHDEMLIRGRAKGAMVDAEGRVCLRGAICCAVGMDESQRRFTDAVWDDTLARDATNAMSKGHYGFIWNDSSERTDDDVLDAFRVVA